MSEPLQRLLESEARARAILDAAKADRQQVLDAALASATQMQQRFEQGRAALRAPYLHEAEKRAEQAVAALSQQHAAHQTALRDLATRHEQAAISAALTLLLDPAA
jgi:V/A-type H+/Na+-transporting ATPase subunit G/H